KRVQQEMRIKRPSLVNQNGVRYFHDEARPRKTKKFGIAMGIYSSSTVFPGQGKKNPDLSDLVPRDIHIFRSL
ncbi:hypothetical protein WH47_11938, partial [Habropoda laboriosa]